MNNEFILLDRIEKIKAINEQYDLDSNAYLSFSGGADSTILHYLLDLALPNNNIPRVFIDTGLEYNILVQYVREMAKKDTRITIRRCNKNIKDTLEKVGYPFKSKQHSHNLGVFERKGFDSRTVLSYLGLKKETIFKCPKKLEYQFNKNFNIKISEKCCNEFKKKPFKEYEKESNKTIVLTGMRRSEGGTRKNIGCVVTEKDKLKKFHPILVCNNEWCEWFKEKYNIKLCDLYYPPYNFKRTGCVGCPYSLSLQRDLDLMEELLPYEKKKCEYIWKPIYDEYRRINYRLKDKLKGDYHV